MDSMVERLDGSRELINRAYAVFVALDDRDKPAPVPPFVPETEEEKKIWRDAEARREFRLSIGNDAKAPKQE